MHAGNQPVGLTNNVALEASIASATRGLLDYRQPDGHWVFELEADSTIPAEYVLLGHFLGEPVDAVLEAKVGNYLCRVQGAQYWSVPEILEGEEYDRIWPLFTADRAWYNDYQAKTNRRIPLIRLPETRPAP